MRQTDQTLTLSIGELAHALPPPIVKSLPALLGLRGLAAVSVVFFHINRQSEVDVPDWLWFVHSHFGHGVFLFFLLSAFSLSHTNTNRIGEPTWLPEYAAKRFFRIAPLFYAVLLSELLRQYMSAGRVISDPLDIIANLTFTFGLFPHKSIVWAGWTIGVEMLFYAVFPFILLYLTSTRRVFLFLVMALFTSLISRYFIGQIDISTGRSPIWAYFAFQSNVWFFALGMATYFLMERFGDQVSKVSSGAIAVIAAGILMFLLWISEQLRFVADLWIFRPDLLVFGVLFTILVAWQYIQPSWLLGNAFTQYLGNRSFSIYLWHPPFLFYLKNEVHGMHDVYFQIFGEFAFLLTSASVLTVLLLLVEFSYRIIEVNGLKVSAIVCGRLCERNA